MSLQSKLTATKDAVQIMMMLGIMAIAFLSAGWLGLSIFANATESDTVTGLPKMPTNSKAEYAVLIKTTGEVLLTPAVDVTNGPNGDELYILHGFYRVVDEKWRYMKTDFTMDEYYWGDLILSKRR